MPDTSAALPRFCGQAITERQLMLIRGITSRYSNLSRTELAATACELLEWLRPNGKPKTVDCREVFETLEQLQQIVLPPQGKKRAKRIAVAIAHAEQQERTPIQVELGQLQPLHLLRVTTAEQCNQWRSLVEQHHYLGHKIPFGAHLRYFIHSEQGFIGCLQYSSPAWRLQARDNWIDWTNSQRKNQLQHVICNSRFLILPRVRVPNPASHVLAQATRQVVVDWQEHFGITPLLLETLADSQRFQGVWYRAANWILVGDTTGRGRNDRHHQRHGAGPKSVWLYPLHRHCRDRLNRKRIYTKRYSSLQGASMMDRPYFCRGCKIGFHPLDEAPELTRFFHQYDIAEKVLKLATEMPYEHAAELVSELNGVPVSNRHGHQTLTQVAETADLETAIPERHEIARRIEQARKTPDDKPVLVVALDSVHAPTRPRVKRHTKRGVGKWREVKGVRLYLAPDGGRIIPIASWHQIQDADAMKADLKKIAERIPQEYVRVALLGDGAAWVWNTLVACFPGGKQVLDYCHCSEHIYKVAEAHCGADPKAIQWYEATISRLASNQIDSVIWGLQRLQGDAAPQEEIDKLITNLTHQQDRLDYYACREAGVPIGSGGIESANKYISHIRLKRSGAWWVIENGNGMLRLRCSMHNGTFDRVFQKYRAQKSSFLVGTSVNAPDACDWSFAADC